MHNTFPNHFVSGLRFFWQGIKLILSPSFKRFIILPIIINAFLFIGLIILAAHYFSDVFYAWVTTYPHWLTLILGWFFWLIFLASSLLICTLIFTVLTNIIASPFYGLLAEKVEKNVASNEIVSNAWWKILPHTLYREAQKLLYFIPWLLLCLGLFIFPLTMPIAPIVWWLVLAWVLAIQYIDYCPDNQQVSFREMLQTIKRAPYTVIGFGSAVTVCMLIPGANLIIPPAAVAGGTALWLSMIQSETK